MNESPSGGSAPVGARKWDPATKAVKELVMRYDGMLPMGLSPFASDNRCGAGKIDVAPAYDTGMQTASSRLKSPTAPAVSRRPR